VHLLKNPVRDYAWGSTTAIPELLGTEPDGTPQAELWMGAHPDAPSRLATTSPGAAPTPTDTRTLIDLIAADPTAALGHEIAETLGPRLPFLLKVLAVEEPLSLQAHPSREQARAGYAAEDRAGVPRDAPERTYGDDNHKPELLWALTPFDALCGFRPEGETLEFLHRMDIPGLRSDVDELSSGAVDLGDLVRRWLLLEAGECRAIVAEMASVCSDIAASGGAFVPEATTIASLAELHPGDGGVLVATLLNRVRLQPGEAVFLAAGNLHAYLHGTGVELMANSDNVLRGGLTKKHVDVDGLLAILDASPGPPALVRPVATPYGDAFPVPVPDFELTVLRPDGVRAYDLQDGSPAVFLTVDGSVELSQGAAPQRLDRGQSAFVGADEPPVGITGDGVIVRASTGRAGAAQVDRTSR